MRRSTLAIAAFAVCVAGVAGWHHFSREDITNPRPVGSNIIALGDSLTSGVGAAAGADYPTQLSKMSGVAVLNKGVPGDTTADALKRLDKDVLAEDPRIVIVLLGGNDFLQQVPQQQTFRNLEEIVTRIQEQGALVVLVGVGGSMLTRSYSTAFRDLARRRGAVLVPNILKGIIDRPSLKADQVHPNGDGYRVVAERIHKRIRKYLP